MAITKFEGKYEFLKKGVYFPSLKGKKASTKNACLIGMKVAVKEIFTH